MCGCSVSTAVLPRVPTTSLNLFFMRPPTNGERRERRGRERERGVGGWRPARFFFLSPLFASHFHSVPGVAEESECAQGVQEHSQRWTRHVDEGWGPGGERERGRGRC